MRNRFCKVGKALDILQGAFNTMDNRLEGHGERVAYIVWKLLKASNNYDEDSIIRVVILAFFHDIGAYKTNKIDKLLNFEIDNPHDHAIYGYLFLKYLSPFKDDLDVILYHHVKYRNLKKLQSENKEKASIVHFADRLDILIRSEIEITIENIDALTEGVVQREALEKFIATNNEYKICENVISGEYKGELLNYLDGYVYDEGDIIEVVKMLVFIIDFRSPQTVTHSIYVWSITELVCDILNISNEEKNEITLAALFHDIGKIATPISILEKEGKLTFEEMTIMKEHVVESKKIIEGLGLSEIANILGMHHEKLDGSGYPEGIGAKDIPFESRIIMVVDIFSALIGERSYKKPYKKESVINILQKLVTHGKLDGDICEIIEENYDYLIENSKRKAEKYIKIYDVINKEFEKIVNEKLLSE